jgi:hypothetical protein
MDFLMENCADFDAQDLMADKVLRSLLKVFGDYRRSIQEQITLTLKTKKIKNLHLQRDYP